MLYCTTINANKNEVLRWTTATQIVLRRKKNTHPLKSEGKKRKKYINTTATKAISIRRNRRTREITENIHRLVQACNCRYSRLQLKVSAIVVTCFRFMQVWLARGYCDEGFLFWAVTVPHRSACSAGRVLGYNLFGVMCRNTDESSVQKLCPYDQRAVWETAERCYTGVRSRHWQT